MNARPRKTKLAVKKISHHEEMPFATLERDELSSPQISRTESSHSSLSKSTGEAQSMHAAKDELQSSSAGTQAPFILRHASAHLLESGIEATMHDIEQILPAFSWDVSAWGQKAKSFVHDVVAKPLWDGIAQVDEMITTAALPQDEVDVLRNLPLSDKTAPLQQHDNGASDASDALGWGDFDIDDFTVCSHLLKSVDQEVETAGPLPGVPRQVEEMEPEYTCMIQRSPLHPPTPHRRSPDHGNSEDYTRAPNENLSTACNRDLDAGGANTSKNCSRSGTGYLADSPNDAAGINALEQQFRQLLSENARLKDEVDCKGGDDIMTQQLLQQLQVAMADKSKIIQEKDELIRENSDLRTLLAYLSRERACDHMPGGDNVL